MFCATEGWSCSQCIPKQSTAAEKARCEDLRKGRGCTERPTIHIIQDPDTGETYDRCVVKRITKESAETMSLFIFMKQGFLPYEGGIMTQPAYMLKRISYVANLIAEYQQEQIRKR